MCCAVPLIYSLAFPAEHTQTHTHARTQSTLYTSDLSSAFFSRLCCAFSSFSHSQTLARPPMHTQTRTCDNTFQLHYSHHRKLAKCHLPPTKMATVILTWHILSPSEKRGPV